MGEKALEKITCWQEILQQVKDGVFPSKRLRRVDVAWPLPGDEPDMPTLRFQLEWCADEAGDALWLHGPDGRTKLRLNNDGLLRLVDLAGFAQIGLNGHRQWLFMSVNHQGVWMSRTQHREEVLLTSAHESIAHALLDALLERHHEQELATATA